MFINLSNEFLIFVCEMKKCLVTLLILLAAVSLHAQSTVVSGYVTDSLISNMLAEENLSALQKPFRPDQFVKFVHSVLYA